VTTFRAAARGTSFCKSFRISLRPSLSRIRRTSRSSTRRLLPSANQLLRSRPRRFARLRFVLENGMASDAEQDEGAIMSGAGWRIPLTGIASIGATKPKLRFRVLEGRPPFLRLSFPAAREGSSPLRLRRPFRPFDGPRRRRRLPLETAAAILPRHWRVLPLVPVVA
jgi:hypothetical protein